MKVQRLASKKEQYFAEFKKVDGKPYNTQRKTKSDAPRIPTPGGCRGQASKLAKETWGRV